MSKPIAPKPARVTKKSQAIAIFEKELVFRANGHFATNKEFRDHILGRMEVEIGVSRASAATMYNEVKKAIEASGYNLKLGRDPKVVTVKKAAAVKAVSADTV
jgi:hypothetical protein